METVVIEKRNQIARVILNRPPLNIVNIGMMDELAAAFESMKQDHATKVVILAANGEVFSAGVDIEDHMPDRAASMLSKFHDVFRILWALEQPIIAAVQGAALGGGCELAMACDFIVASESARFGQPEIKLGVFAPMASFLLPRLVGRIKANELLLTGDSIGAREAERLGLVNRVAPAASFDAAVDACAARLTSSSGVVLRHAKRAIALGSERGLDAIESLYLTDTMNTEDAIEGLTAFMDKRAPVWKEK